MKAVFVFCEGNHDVAFVTRSLGQVAKTDWVGDPIGKLPSPLGPVHDPTNPKKPKIASIITRHYSDRTLDDLRLKAAAHARLPAFEAILKTTDTIYVLIRCQGAGAAQAAIELIDKMNAVLDPEFGTDVKELAAAFLFDADESLSGREATFATEYASLLQGVSAPTHGTWVKGSHRVGLYVFHDQNNQRGTLEDLLAPLVEAQWNTRWLDAHTYLNAHAQPADPVRKKRAEWLKAQINVTGQFLFPGDPMTEVINRRGLSASHFDGQESKQLVSFLQGAPW
ncbi:DUF3226 domain-containing protein [Steroidobacter flavus]|uniref:DUF3226 domain-containing protein n=1 Tax=Steroidobacter flavus TaxID=1842136 RepID=A0ABV8SZI6_9GAMM